MSKRRIIFTICIIIVFIIAIVSSKIYYSNKYIVSFETGTNESLLNKYVSINSKVSKPKTPIKEGYVFIEWQLDGKTYDFDTPVNNNIILTAKWIKEEYIVVSFDTDTKESIDDMKILKGTSIKELPNSYKEGYEFIGWYINGEKYSDKVLYDDTTLVARYKKEGIKVGDEVKIIGKYAETSYSKKALNKKAIGWNRKIVAIYEGRNYPYAVGNDSGITGFFKENSIKIISKGERLWKIEK